MANKAIKKKYYVYVHKYASGPKEGRVFYVGKGSGKRAGSSYGRSKYWHRIKSKYGFTYEIVRRFDNEFCSYSFEKILVGLYGRENLCNLTDGGDGSFNPSQETRDKISISISGDKHYKFKHEVIKFSHPELGVFSGTMYDFYNKYSILPHEVSRMVNGHRMSVKGWIVGEAREIDRAEKLRGENHYQYDKTVYEFRNSDGDVFLGTQYEFRNKFDFPQCSVWQLVNGGVSTVRGWWIGKTKPKRKVRDTSEHAFVGKNGEVYTGKIKDVSEMTGVSKTSLCELRDGVKRRVKGFSYIQKPCNHPPTSFAA